MTRRRSLALPIAALVLFAAVAAWQVGRWRSSPGAGGALASDDGLPLLGRVPPFELTSQDGRPVRRTDFSGRPWVVDFVFTRCAGQCPPMTAAMAGLARRTADAPALRFLSVSVDPTRDTPEALRAYGERHAADFTRWTFGRADEGAVRALARDGFKLAVEAGSPGDPEPILHSSRFILVDAQGSIRGYYDGLDPAAVDRLESDARSLLRGESSGSPR